MGKQPDDPLKPLPVDDKPYKNNMHSRLTSPHRQGLNPRQEMFCLEYVRDMNGAAAYRRAGFRSVKNINRIVDRLMSMPKVKSKIADLKAERAARLNLDADKVVEMILDVYESSMKSGDHSPAVRACDLLGKHINLFKDNNQTVVKIAGMSGGNSLVDVDKDIERLLPIATYRSPHTDTADEPD
jgi:phage terminase small subunit